MRFSTQLAILTLIGKSRKQNPKIGISPSVSSKQNPEKLQKLYFGNVTARDLRKRNPDKKSRFLFLWDFWDHHCVIYGKKFNQKFRLDFVSRNHARWQTVPLYVRLEITHFQLKIVCFGSKSIIFQEKLKNHEYFFVKIIESKIVISLRANSWHSYVLSNTLSSVKIKKK